MWLTKYGNVGLGILFTLAVDNINKNKKALLPPSKGPVTTSPNKNGSSVVYRLYCNKSCIVTQIS